MWILCIYSTDMAPYMSNTVLCPANKAYFNWHTFEMVTASSWAGECCRTGQRRCRCISKERKWTVFQCCWWRWPQISALKQGQDWCSQTGISIQAPNSICLDHETRPILRPIRKAVGIGVQHYEERIHSSIWRGISRSDVTGHLHRQNGITASKVDKEQEEYKLSSGISQISRMRKSMQSSGDTKQPFKAGPYPLKYGVWTISSNFSKVSAQPVQTLARRLFWGGDSR